MYFVQLIAYMYTMSIVRYGHTRVSACSTIALDTVHDAISRFDEARIDYTGEQVATNLPVRCNEAYAYY